MPTYEQQIALRDRLRAAEDDLVAAGKRNIRIDCAAGVFTWVRRGAGREPNEHIAFIDDIQEIEDMIVSEGRDHLVMMTGRGTFTWRLRDQSEKRGQDGP